MAAAHTETTLGPAPSLIGGVTTGNRITGVLRCLAAAAVLLSLVHWGSATAASPTVGSAGSAALDLPPCDLALAPAAGRASSDERIAALQNEIAHAVDRIPLLERLGWALVEKSRESSDPGYYTVAAACARCILEADANNPSGLLLQGHIDHSLHRFRAAEQVARKLVAQRGAWFDHGLLGDALMERGRLAAAAEHYQTMMDLRPGPQSYSRASHLHWLLGDPSGAVELMRMAVASVSPRDRESAAWMRARLAQLLIQQGELKSAEQTVRQSLAILPEYPPGLLVLGRLQLANADCAAAIEPLQRAAATNPLPDYLWALLEALQGCGRDAEAGQVRDRLIATGAANDGRTTALYLASSGINVERALRLARQEIRERQDVHSYDALAWALAANGRDAKAYKVSRSAIAAGTADARIFYHAGVIAARVGHLSEADRLLRRADEIDHILLPSERKQLSRQRAQLRQMS